MTVSLTRSYAGYAAGTIVGFDGPTETALVQQGFGTASSAVPTAGAISTTQPNGRCAIATGTLSVVVTNPAFTPSSKVSAYIAQATADGTLTQIVRIVPAAGSVTIYGNANATAPVVVDWVNEVMSGETAVN
jgi:hypothetical protein